MQIVLIIAYIILLIVVYMLVIKRLRFLNNKHIKHTGVEHLERVYRGLSNVIFLLLFLLGGISVVTLIMTF